MSVKKEFKVYVTISPPDERVLQLFDGCLQDENQATIEDNIPDFAEFIGGVAQAAVLNSFKELETKLQEMQERVTQGKIESTLTITMILSQIGNPYRSQVGDDRRVLA